MNVSIVRKIKKKMKRLKMRYIPTVVVAFSCDFVVANPILIKKQVSNGISNINTSLEFGKKCNFCVKDKSQNYWK